MKKLENRVSVITGAGSGMGKEIAILFAQEGSKIIAADINEERLNLLEKEIKELGGEVKICITNVAKEEDVNAMIDLAVSEYGTLDILVNNAGVMDNFDPAGDTSNEMYDKMMKINAEGPFKATRKALSIFTKKNKGVIVNITSISGLYGGRAGVAYTMSKHALVGLTKSTGYLYSKTGIRCNGIAPGDIRTNLMNDFNPKTITPMTQDRIFAGLPLSPKSAQPDAIAKTALFLASDDANFINGQILTVDGGWSVY